MAWFVAQFVFGCPDSPKKWSTEKTSLSGVVAHIGGAARLAVTDVPPVTAGEKSCTHAPTVSVALAMGASVHVGGDWSDGAESL